MALRSGLYDYTENFGGRHHRTHALYGYVPSVPLDTDPRFSARYRLRQPEAHSSIDSSTKGLVFGYAWLTGLP